MFASGFIVFASGFIVFHSGFIVFASMIKSIERALEYIQQM